MTIPPGLKRFAAQLTFLMPSAVLVATGTFAGAFVMGIVIPAILFVITAMIFDDMGGPIFWPVFVIFMLMLGTALGFTYSILWVGMFWLLRCLIPKQYQVAPTWHHTFREKFKQPEPMSQSAASRVSSSTDNPLKI